MNTFLREARKFRNITERLCIVMGNESCDLDSAVSSLSLAYFLHKNHDKIPSNNKTTNVLPIFNIKRKEFPIKTEVTYFLNLNSIDTELITFKDDIDENLLHKNDLILVDHHVSPYSNCVIAVYDHRPFDDNSNLPKNCLKQIKRVGSCSTLIADLFLDLHNSRDYIECLRLLYGAIILDTICFSKTADKATIFDSVVAFEIENLLNLDDPAEYRELLFDDLINARNDISKLDSYQLLYKDMKLININNEKLNDNNLNTIALPGYPILVKDYLKIDNMINDNIKKFSKINNCSLIILIGMKINKNNSNELIKRDLCIINISNDKLYDKIINILLNSNEPNLQLEEYNEQFNLQLNYKIFKQNNIKATRKQIIPLVKIALNQLQQQQQQEHEQEQE